MTVKRFTIDKEYDTDGNWEYCYVDNDTGRTFNFADDFCHIDFIELINAIIDSLNDENEQLRIEKDNAQTKHSYELIKKLEYKSKLIDLKKENEHLKSEINMLKNTIARNDKYIAQLTQKGEWKRCSYD